MQKDKTPAFHLLVIDGNQSENKKQRQNKWSTSRLPPAFAGMTNKTEAPLVVGRSCEWPKARPRTGHDLWDDPEEGLSLQTPIHQSENPAKRSFLGAVEKAFIKEANAPSLLGRRTLLLQSANPPSSVGEPSFLSRVRPPRSRQNTPSSVGKTANSSSSVEFDP